MPRPTSAERADTIFALSSGRPPAAIAIVRVSGPAAGWALREIGGPLPEPRRATVRTLRRDGEVLDRGLVLWFPGSATATGEDLAELHLHGGIAIVDAVLAALTAIGLRAAEPGEFTRRALINGRLDLAEVEGLADLLGAETESQRREAMLRANGALGRQLDGWGQRLVTIAARIEAAIDFDGEDEIATAHDDAPIRSLRDEITAALARPPAERLRDGVRVVIVGPPNAGKSTLFNALVGHEAAIVSDRPGTTRDILERPVAIRGVPFLLLDTAGDRDAIDLVERIGVSRARAAAASADIILDLAEEATADQRRLAVRAQIDRQPERPDRINVCAIDGRGIATLVDRLLARATVLLPVDGEASFAQRHRSVLAKVERSLSAACDTDDAVLVADHVRDARERIDSLTGASGPAHVLDAIFARFCLGK